MFLFLQFQPFRGLCAALRTPVLFLRARHILRQLRRRLVQHGHKFIAGDGLFFVQVLGQLIQLAADTSLSWMTLEVRRSNKVAQNLYHKLGFIDVGYRKRYYENQEDALVMALEHLPEAHPENDPMLVRE